MKKYSSLIKNLIMVVASALTLVAVSFAWFTSSFSTNLDQYEVAVGGDTIKVDYYQMDDAGAYQPLPGDIELKDFVPGKHNKYKFDITTKTSDKLNLKFEISGIPVDMPQELKDSVQIKYSIWSQKKQTTGGTVAYVDSEFISQSEDYVLLSKISDGVIINSLSLGNYQKTSSDRFAIYYEIGLSENAPPEVSGLESSLGSIKISAQRIG